MSHPAKECLRPVIHLVGHGPAAFGSDDHDVLSPLGEFQAAVVGSTVASADISPEFGGPDKPMHQRRTAQLASSAADWLVTPRVNANWNELDHEGGLRRAELLVVLVADMSLTPTP